MTSSRTIHPGVSDAIRWWENVLTPEERTEMFDSTVFEGASWSDIGENDEEGIKKRHAWLLERYGDAEASRAPPTSNDVGIRAGDIL